MNHIEASTECRPVVILAAEPEEVERSQRRSFWKGVGWGAGQAIGAIAMLRLKSLPEADRIAGGIG